MGVWYATREQVKESLETMETAHAGRLIDQKLDAASRSVEGQLRRRFYPEQRVVKMDWPNYQYAPAWRLWLGINELIALTTVVSGGTDITTSAVPRRTDDIAEPPYNLLEISLAGAGSFSSGVTFQQSVVMTGLFGYSDTATVNAAGALPSTMLIGATTAVINPVNGNFPLGIGSLLKIESERLIVTNRRMIDTTINTTVALAASQNVQTVGVGDATGFAIGEIIMVDAERMRVEDIAGNNLMVTRAFDGSTLAAHLTAADVFALRNFTLTRGVLGSVAAQHLNTAPVYAHEWPGILNELTIAETVVLLEQNASAYARTIGSGNSLRQSGTGQGLEDLREQAQRQIGRPSRMAAI